MDEMKQRVDEITQRMADALAWPRKGKTMDNMNTPTKPGWYWYADYCFNEPVIQEVAFQGRMLVASGNGGRRGVPLSTIANEPGNPRWSDAIPKPDWIFNEETETWEDPWGDPFDDDEPEYNEDDPDSEALETFLEGADREYDELQDRRMDQEGA